MPLIAPIVLVLALVGPTVTREVMKSLELHSVVQVPFHAEEMD